MLGESVNGVWWMPGESEMLGESERGSVSLVKVG